MLDSRIDQAQGLCGLEPAPLARWVPVVALTPAAPSLDLLWALHRQLEAQGLEVAVLDVAQLLSIHGSLPQPRAMLRAWHAQVPPGTLMLLYAPVEILAVLLADTAARPLVPVNAYKETVVQAYNAAKVLVQAAGLQPVLVPPAGPAAVAGLTDTALHKAVESLLHCARLHLQSDLSVWPLEYHDPQSGASSPTPSASLLKVLESAWVMPESPDVARAPLHEHPIRHYEALRTLATPGVPDVHRQRHA